MAVVQNIEFLILNVNVLADNLISFCLPPLPLSTSKIKFYKTLSLANQSSGTNLAHLLCDTEAATKCKK